MAFYIIEKEEQLEKIRFKDCFVDFIQHNDYYHPKLSSISLVYIRDISHSKGYIICINHSESFSIDYDKVCNWLLYNTNKLFVLNKKDVLYHFEHAEKIFDINFIENIDTSDVYTPCHEFYFRKHTERPDINLLIPISKHYEKSEFIFSKIKHVIEKYNENDDLYKYNNDIVTNLFYNIEKHGIRLDKDAFKKIYKDKINNPQYNILNGKIYTKYNLYTTTGRPSNSFNEINFLALDKEKERECYVPSNDVFVSIDIQGYHPRILGELTNFKFPDNENTYVYLSNILNISPKEAKEFTFKQMYGGVWNIYKDKPFFSDILKFTNKIWEEYDKNQKYITKNRIFYKDINLTPPKLLNYVIQNKETTNNVYIINEILCYLKNKKTKLILYMYDEILLDFCKDDGKETIENIKRIIKYPTNIKYGSTYGTLNPI